MFKELYRVFYLESQSIKMAQRSKIKKFLINVAVIIIVFAIVFGILSDFLSSADQFISVFPGLEIPTLVIQLGMSASLLFCLLMSFTSIFTIFYYDKNLENYLVFPISSKVLIRSKFLVILVQVMQVVAVVLLPFIVSYVYLTLDNINIMGIIALLLYIPIVSTVMMCISAFFLSILMYFVNKIKNKAIARAIVIGLFALVMVGAYFLYLFSVMNISTSEPGAELTALLSTIDTITQNPLFEAMMYIPNTFVSLIRFDILDFFIGLLPLILIIVTSFYVFEKLFFKGALGFNEAGSVFSKRGTKLEESKKSSVLKLSVLKEKNEILKTGVYMFNTILGTVFMTLIFLFFAIYILIFSTPSDQLEIVRSELVGITTISGYGLILIGYTAFMTMGNAGCATSFSREAKNLDLIRTLPINPSIIFFGKIIFHSTITFICEFVFIAFVSSVLGVDPIIILTGIPVTILAVFVTGFASALVDVAFPNLDWESEAIIIKKSRSAFVGVLVSFLLLIVIIGGNILLFLNVTHTIEMTFIVNVVVFTILLVLEIYFYDKLVNKKIKLN